MIDYSHLIDYMLGMLTRHRPMIEPSHSELQKTLTKLRLYSDMAFLIGYPKNPRISLAYLRTLQHERDRYVKFRIDLSLAVTEFLQHFAIVLDTEYQSRLSELKTVQHLFHLTKNPPETPPPKENGVIVLREITQKKHSLILP